MADEMERRQHSDWGGGSGRGVVGKPGVERVDSGSSITGLRPQMPPCSITVRTSLKKKTLSYGSLAPAVETFGGFV